MLYVLYTLYTWALVLILLYLNYRWSLRCYHTTNHRCSFCQAFSLKFLRVRFIPLPAWHLYQGRQSRGGIELSEFRVTPWQWTDMYIENLTLLCGEDKSLERLIKNPLLLYHKDVIIFVQKLIEGVGRSPVLLGSRCKSYIFYLLLLCLVSPQSEHLSLKEKV